MIKEMEFSLEKACQSTKYLTNLEEIIQTHPCESARTFGMSIISLFDEKNEESLRHLELLAEGNPNIILIHQRIAEFCIDFGKYEKAVVHLEKVVELEKQDLTAQFWLCLIYHTLGKTGKARKSFEYLKEFVYRIRVKTRNWRED
jgi:tetratricopeptide (TPR) repeat protein